VGLNTLHDLSIFNICMRCIANLIDFHKIPSHAVMIVTSICSLWNIPWQIGINS